MPYATCIKRYFGHEATAHVEDLSPSTVVENGMPDPAAIDRLVCKLSCRRGRPKVVAMPWDSTL
jgi:hypothetical protein